MITTLLLGDFSTADLAPVESVLRSLAFDDQIRACLAGAEIESLTSDGWTPDLVVVAQNWPDEYSPVEVRNLLTRFPLARWYCCFGPWCDSDGRTRDLWPLAIRIRAADALALLYRELSDHRCESPLPWTASRSEVFEAVANGTLPRGMKALRVAVSSPDRAWHDLWLCALRRAGCQILSSDETSRAEVLLWDSDPWNESRKSELSSLHRKFPQIRILGVVGWYSEALATEVVDNGATAVACKLSAVTDILRLIAMKPNVP